MTDVIALRRRSAANISHHDALYHYLSASVCMSCARWLLLLLLVSCCHCWRRGGGTVAGGRCCSSTVVAVC